MARRTKEQEQVTAALFPYEVYRSTKAWQVLDGALSELVLNRDIIEETDRRYIVGFLIQRLSEKGAILKRSSSRSLRRKTSANQPRRKSTASPI